MLRLACLYGKGMRGRGGCVRRGAIQMERAADQGGSGDGAHDDPGRGEQHGEQQTEQSDTTGS